jgi:hypothetical protein
VLIILASLGTVIADYVFVHTGNPKHFYWSSNMALGITVIFLIFGSLSPGHPKTIGADWRLYGESEFGSYHYNAKNIAYLPDHLVRAWQKLVLTDKGRVDLTGELGKEYDSVNELIVLREIDCSSRRSRILEVAYRGEEGGTIKREAYQLVDWNSIIAYSADDILYHAVCKQFGDRTSAGISSR